MIELNNITPKYKLHYLLHYYQKNPLPQNHSKYQYNIVYRTIYDYYEKMRILVELLNKRSKKIHNEFKNVYKNKPESLDYNDESLFAPTIYDFCNPLKDYYELKQIKNQYYLVVETELSIYKHWEQISPLLSILIREFSIWIC